MANATRATADSSDTKTNIRTSEKQERQRIYDHYLGNTAHVNGWDLLDVSAPHILGAHLLDRRRAEHRLLDRLASSPSV